MKAFAATLARANLGNSDTPKRKRTNFRWPSMGINYPANRPDPDCPGGLGAEESGAERTGPTHEYVLATQRGGRLAEVGRYYDSANDPVTACFRSNRAANGTFRRVPGLPSTNIALAAGPGRRNHVTWVTGDGA